MSCYVYNLELDDNLSQVLGSSEFGVNLSPKVMHLIRQVYDGYALLNNLDTLEKMVNDGRDYDYMAHAINSYLKVGRSKALQEYIKSARHNARGNMRKLSVAMPDSTLKATRVNDLIYFINCAILDIQDTYQKSIEEVLLGFTDALGNTIGGISNILDNAYNDMLDTIQYLADTGEEYSAEQLSNIINNWGALLVYAKRHIKDRTGVDINTYNSAALKDAIDDSDVGSDAQLYDQSQATKESYQKKHDLESALKTIGNITRTLIFNTYWQEGISQMGSSKEDRTVPFDDLDIPVPINPVKVHRDLKTLTNGAIDEQSFIRLLEEHMNENIEEYGYLSSILQVVKNNHQALTLLYTDLKRDWTPYSIIQSVTRSLDGVVKNKTIDLNKDKSLWNKTVSLIKKNGYRSFGDSFISNSTGQIDPFEFDYSYTADGNPDISRGYKTWVTGKGTQVARNLANLVYSVYKKNNSGKYSALEALQQMNSYQKEALLNLILRKMNIPYSGSIKDLANSDETINRILGRVHQILYEIHNNAFDTKGFKKLQSISVKSSLYDIIFGESELGSVIRNNYKRITDIITEFDSFRISDIEASVSYKDLDGKYNTYYSHTLPSFLGQFVSQINYYIRENKKLELKWFITNKYLKSKIFKGEDGTIYNPWILEILNACNNSNKSLRSSIGNLFLLNRELGGLNTDFENYSLAQFGISLWTNFFAAEELNKLDEDGEKYARYTIFVTGDSGSLKYITARRYTIDEVVNKLFTLTKSEKNRLNLVRNFNAFCESKGIEGLSTELHKAANLQKEYTLLDFLDKNYKMSKGIEKGKYYNIIQKGKNAAMSATVEDALALGKTLALLQNEIIEKATKDAIREYLNDAADRWKKIMLKRGIIDKEGNGVKINRTLYNKDNIDAKILDFVSNHTLATAALMQMMTVDPGFYDGVIDLQKRYKEIHSSGNILSTTARDFNGKLYAPNKYMSTIYFKKEKGEYADENTPNGYNPEVIEVLKNRYGEEHPLYKAHKNGKFPLADGQSIRHIASFRKVLGMSGRWSEALERAFKRIQEIRAELRKAQEENSRYDKEAYKKLTLELFNMVEQFQPIKPFMFTIEEVTLKNGETMLIPVLYKCSEALIIPELLEKDSPLRALVEYMEENDIDVACEDSAIKVGTYGSFDFHAATKNSEMKEIIRKTARVHKLDYNDYRIVSNVPEHAYNSRLVGTQLRKIFFNSIYALDENTRIANDSKYAMYITDDNGLALAVRLTESRDPALLNTATLISLYNALVSADMVSNYQDFLKTITNPNALSNMFMENALRNDRGVEATIDGYDLDNTDTSKFVTPIFDGVLASENIAYLLSAFRRKVNQQRTSGGSLVQVTSLGINNYRHEKGLEYIIESVKDNKGNEKKINILAAECEVPAELLVYRDDAGFEHLVDLTPYVDYKGDFILADGGKTDRYGKPLTKIEEDFPDILSLVAYRVPTEREYSMINLRIKRVTPKIFGGTIKVPLPHTLISGFDFDIDKLYFMRKSYTKRRVYKSLSDTTINNAWRKVWGMPLGNLPAQGTTVEYYVAKKLQEMDEARGNKPKRLHEYLTEAGFNKDLLFENALSEMGISKDSWGMQETVLDAYDYNKTPYANTKEARDNLFFDLIRKRLEDPDTLESRLTPGGYADLSKAANEVKKHLFGKQIILEGEEEVEKHMEPEYSYSNPETMLIFTEQNQVAEKVIGIMANHSSNAYYTGIMKKFAIKPDVGITFQFAGHLKYHNLVNPDVNGSLIVALLLAAAVDAVKDPVLPYLNINLSTANVAALLARLGYNGYEIGIFLNLPIIREVCDKINDDKVHITRAVRQVYDKYAHEGVQFSELKKNVSKNNYDLTTMERMIDSYRDAEEDPEVFYNDTRNSVGEARRNHQLAMLALFSNIAECATALGDFVKNTKFTSANSIPTTLGEIFEITDRVLQRNGNIDRYFNIDNSIWDTNTGAQLVSLTTNYDIAEKPQEYLDGLTYNTFAFELCMYDLINNFIHVLNLKKYTPYESGLYSNLRNYMYDLNIYGTNSGQSVEQLHKDIPLWFLSLNTAGYFNPTAKILFTDVDGKTKKATMKDYYTLYFPKLFELFMGGLASKLIVTEREIKTGKINRAKNEVTTTVPEIRVVGESKFRNTSVKNEASDLIRNLPIEVQRDLLLYNLYKFGNNYSYSGFAEVIPTTTKTNVMATTSSGELLSYNNLIYLLVDLSAPDILQLSRMLQQFVLNNLNNEQFVLNVPRNSNDYEVIKARALVIDAKVSQDGTSIYEGADELKFRIERSDDQLVNVLNIKLAKVGDGVLKMIVPPVLKFGNTYYIADNMAGVSLEGSLSIFNTMRIELDDNFIVPALSYRRVNTTKNLGTKFGYSSNFSLEEINNSDTSPIEGYDYNGSTAVSLSDTYYDNSIMVIDSSMNLEEALLKKLETILKNHEDVNDIDWSNSIVRDALDYVLNGGRNNAEYSRIATEKLKSIFMEIKSNLTEKDRLVKDENGELTVICKI